MIEGPNVSSGSENGARLQGLPRNLGGLLVSTRRNNQRHRGAGRSRPRGLSRVGCPGRGGANFWTTHGGIADEVPRDGRGGIGAPHSTEEAGEPLQRDSVEGRGRRIAELRERKMTGTPRPESISTKQTRIANLARQMPGKALTSLAHHMDLAWLAEAFRRTRKDGAVGVDGQTAGEYETNLMENLQGLLNRAKSGSYRAPPVRRVLIPKGDGSKTRPIGIPTFEDKILQRAVVMLLEPVFEYDFYDFSYGFRPGRSAHNAIDSLSRDIRSMGGGWVLDVDVKAFFDTLVHKTLRDLLSQRIADGVITRLVGKWLHAGVLDGGVVTHSELGTPQGGVISPLLANIYLHVVLDEWWDKEVLPRLKGRASLVRYADDFVIVFSVMEDALRVQEVLPKRFNRFGLTLHPEKTKLVRFRPARKDDPKPGSFDFLGFTFYWGRPRKGGWRPQRKTAKSRFTRGLKALNRWMRAARHFSLPKQAITLAQKLRGHMNYYGIAGNSRAINRFHYEVRRLWYKWLRRRSQRTRVTWEWFNRMLERLRLPPARLRPVDRQLRLANL